MDLFKKEINPTIFHAVTEKEKEMAEKRLEDFYGLIELLKLQGKIIIKAHNKSSLGLVKGVGFFKEKAIGIKKVNNIKPIDVKN